MPRISALYVYPIKSCAGIAVDAAQVLSRGLQFDRRFMLVDDNGRFLTQRQNARMALLSTAIDDGLLTVTRPDGDTLRLPLVPAYDSAIAVKVWRSQLEAQLADEDTSAWFGDFLERPARLVYMAEHQHRAVSRDRATAAGDEVSFADGAPILLTSEGSLADLNGRLSRPVTMQRFRPNIVVDEPVPWAEDGWRHIRAGGTPFEVAWSCARCVMTTIDPATGVRDEDGEPLATLREFRREGHQVLFGQNVLTRGPGMLRVGDSVEVML